MMRIALVAPLIESVPPKTYGGTERIVSFLTDKLVEMQHDVTLFASGDSVTKAKLIAPIPVSLRYNTNVIDPFAHLFYMLELVQQMKHEFDIIHYHVDYFHFPFSRRNNVAQCTTMHGRLDIPDLKVLFKEFSEMPLISISDSQRLPLSFSNFIQTVHHGLPVDLLKFHEKSEQYLAFLGRISPEKRVDRAIEIAKRAGIPLKIAAKIDNADMEYYKNKIEPLMDHSLIEFVGEINDREKNDFLGNAHAVLFPIDWPEPFGLVMIESMACGTPIIAFNCGSVPEVIDEGKTGFIVDNLEQAVESVKNIDAAVRPLCRKIFERRFSDQRMADDYVKIYERLIKNKNPKPATI